MNIGIAAIALLFGMAAGYLGGHQFGYPELGTAAVLSVEAFAMIGWTSYKHQ